MSNAESISQESKVRAFKESVDSLDYEKNPTGHKGKNDLDFSIKSNFEVRSTVTFVRLGILKTYSNRSFF